MIERNHRKGIIKGDIKKRKANFEKISARWILQKLGLFGNIKMSEKGRSKLCGSCIEIIARAFNKSTETEEEL